MDSASALQTDWSDDNKAQFSPDYYPEQKSGTQQLDDNVDALKEFSVISKQFIDSYHQLESQVNRLSVELAAQTAEKEQKALENEHLASRLQTILETLPSGVVVIDGHGVVRQANPMAEDMLGKRLEGSIWIEVIGRAFAPRSDDGHEISLIDGRRVKVETKAIGSEPGQIVSLTDLTETRRLQENQSREQRLSVIGKMMASLAHQIRTPLSSALLYSGQLTSQRLPAEKLYKFQKHLNQSLKQLELYVSDMLLFASGGVAKEQRFGVSEFISAIKHEVIDNLFPDTDIEISNDIQAIDTLNLYGNRQALLGAISNLIVNSLHACKDNQVKGRLTSVQIEFYCHANTRLSISVKDNGCGIETQQLPKIFEPFYTGKARGTGLGLAVVKTVVDNFKGQIEVSSQQGKGTNIEIRLPIVNADPVCNLLDSQIQTSPVGGI